MESENVGYRHDTVASWRPPRPGDGATHFWFVPSPYLSLQYACWPGGAKGLAGRCCFGFLVCLGLRGPLGFLGFWGSPAGVAWGGAFRNFHGMFVYFLRGLK